MMDPFHKNERWVPAEEIELEPCGEVSPAASWPTVTTPCVS